MFEREFVGSLGTKLKSPKSVRNVLEVCSWSTGDSFSSYISGIGSLHSRFFVFFVCQTSPLTSSGLSSFICKMRYRSFFYSRMIRALFQTGSSHDCFLIGMCGIRSLSCKLLSKTFPDFNLHLPLDMIFIDLALSTLPELSSEHLISMSPALTPNIFAWRKPTHLLSLGSSINLSRHIFHSTKQNEVSPPHVSIIVLRTIH